MHFQGSTSASGKGKGPVLGCRVQSFALGKEMWGVDGRRGHPAASQV